MAQQFPCDTEDEEVDEGVACDVCVELEVEEAEEEVEEDVGSMSCPIASALADPQQSAVPSALQHHRPPAEALQGCTTDDCGESKAISDQLYFPSILDLVI